MSTKTFKQAVTPKNIKAAKKLQRMWGESVEEINASRKQYVPDPRAFTKVKKIDFDDCFNFVAFLSKGNLAENIRLNTGSSVTYTPQAMLHRLEQISPAAFEDWFHNSYIKLVLNCHIEHPKWHVYALDGTENRYYHHRKEKKMKRRTRGLSNSSLRAVVLYDVTNDLMVDAELTPDAKTGEPACAIKLIERNDLPDNAVILEDRAYGGLQTIAAHQEHNIKTVARMKDQTSEKSLLFNKEMPDEAYDLIRGFYVSKSKKKRDISYCQENKLLYVHHPGDFKYYTEDDKHYIMYVRLIRFFNPPVRKGEKGEWIILATNLTYEEMSTEEIIKLYTKRWPIETSFLKVKQFLDLEYFHSSKTQLVIQEFWAKLTLYNFVSFFSKIYGTIHKVKYDHHMNWSTAYRSVIEFLMDKKEVSIFLEEIFHYSSAQRDGRHSKRKPSRSKGAHRLRG